MIALTSDLDAQLTDTRALLHAAREFEARTGYTISTETGSIIRDIATLTVQRDTERGHIIPANTPGSPRADHAPTCLCAMCQAWRRTRVSRALRRAALDPADRTL